MALFGIHYFYLGRIGLGIIFWSLEGVSSFGGSLICSELKG